MFPVPATLVRWLGLSAMALVVGTLALDVIVLPRAGAGPGATGVRLRRWILLGVLALAVAWAGELLVRAQTMSGGDLVAAARAIPAVLLRTHFGTIWTARVALLVVLFALALVGTAPARTVALLLALGVALTTSMTGHAADRGDLSVAVFVDWVHVAAATAWTGGLFGLVVAVLGGRASWPLPVLAASLRRFSAFAGLCLLLVVLSGVYTSWTQLSSVSDVWTTPYGRVLAVKVALVSLLAWLGATNRYLLLPRLTRPGRPGRLARAFRMARLAFRRRTREGRPPLARLSTFVAREAGLAVLVFGCTAVLGELTPARHAGHLVPDATSMDGTSRHVTMEELHRGPGVPPGWMFTPPRGDAGRGREVFARLKCFACHTVSGERFPAPSGRGPDLTGIGAHHPAGYLAESVLNPSAVVVEGPGYVAPDGSSTMPDYRAALTVEEFIDLVAYLQSLGGEHHHPSR